MSVIDDFNKYTPYLEVANEFCSNTIQMHQELKGQIKAELDYEELVLQASAESDFASCAQYHQELIESRSRITARTQEEHERAQAVAHDLRELNQRINLAYRKASQQSPDSSEAKQLERLMYEVKSSISQVDENIRKIEKSFQELNQQVEALQAAHPNATRTFGKII